ncbi:MAG: aminotransferase class I/II-fold pyridoxal phosphate-dependent enzyme, partial [Roseinatronobacter sp.]|nr:aminotransferase class I/II-fold pyridoxal phosphate-dependent enzyme [Roseinatronobacter sp.]
MSTPRYTDLVCGLPATVPFVGPEAHMRATGRAFRARLGANESVFGPSPKAVEAMQAAAADVWMYGDSQSHDLRVALAAHHGVGPENIMLGEGIDGLLGLLVRLMVGPGDTVVTSDGAYPTFNYHVAGFGGVLHKVPYRDDHEDPTALLERAEAVGAKLLYFCNPDNPMGSWHSERIVQRLIEAVPDGT